MKNFSLSTLMMFLICFLSSNSNMFGSSNDSLTRLEIKGRVMIPQTELSKSYRIELFSNNQMIDSASVVDDEPFLLRVEKNTFYSVRIVKNGYLPMVVSINTQNPYSNKFNFDEEYFVTLYGFNLSLSLLSQPPVDERFAHQQSQN